MTKMSSLLNSALFAAAVWVPGLASADDIVAKGTAPKWHSKTPTEEISKVCSEEKDPKARQSACGAVMSRYANMDAMKIPKAAQDQAQEILKRHQESPKDPLTTFDLHNAHQVLGLLALQAGDLKTAKEKLLQSVQVPKTPALEHMGPRFKLAEELLAKGEKKAVLDYLDQIEKAGFAGGVKEKAAELRARAKQS